MRVGKLFVQIKALLKSVHTSAGINELLFSGKERMAFGTNFNVDVLLGRRSLDHVTACASNGGLIITRMDVLFHSIHLFRRNHTLTL